MIVNAGQGQERSIKKLFQRNEPIKITKLKAKGRLIRLGEKFVAEDDWLKGLTISVKNTSGKSIVFIEIGIQFPRTAGATQERIAVDTLVYGSQELPLKVNDSPDTSPPIVPGETVDIKLSDEQLGAIKRLLRETNYPAQILRVEMMIRGVLFSDDTKWIGGELFRRDPNDSETWIRMDQPSSQAPNERYRYLALNSNHLDNFDAFRRASTRSLEDVSWFGKASISPAAGCY
jgi:hypothetical protein